MRSSTAQLFEYTPAATGTHDTKNEKCPHNLKLHSLLVDLDRAESLIGARHMSFHQSKPERYVGGEQATADSQECCSHVPA